MIRLLVECTVIWLLCGIVLSGGMTLDPTAVWYYVVWWNARWFYHHVVLYWLVECTMILSPCGTVLIGGMHDDLITMWYCTDWWNARWSYHYVVLCWLVECTMIWLPCGTVLRVGMLDDLTIMCVDWSVLTMECTTIWLPRGTVLTDGTHAEILSLIPAFKRMWFASFDYSWYPSSTMNVCHWNLFRWRRRA